ncbi:hypothetical protein [Halocatena marina]|uniref:hypothetical protein n=1 Tax=Halocatena marina TaxID=2934937 RepID=UPI00200D7EAD|nr:hypothetical protein [Halocatena marina]
MRIKYITYQVVWKDNGERREKQIKCDETKHVDGKRQFIKDGEVKLAISTDALISYKLENIQCKTINSLSELIETAKLHYRYNYRHKLPFFN